MILREMQVEDLDQVMEIETALFSVPWTREGYFTYLIKENTMFLVVEEKGQILGYCGLLMVLDEGDVLNVAVKKERQREGIGYFMMDALIRLAGDLGVRTFHLEVRAGNDTARRLYERLGFAQEAVRRNYYTDPAEDALVMSLAAACPR